MIGLIVRVMLTNRNINNVYIYVYIEIRIDSVVPMGVGRILQKFSNIFSQFMLF